MRLISFISSLLIGLFVFSQNLDKTVHHFGKVQAWNNPTAEFIYTNTSGTSQYFLPIAYMNDVSVSFEKSELQAGESCKIFVNYYTEEFGSFERNVEIYVNTLYEAVQLKIDGKIVSFHPDAYTYCPRIENSSMQSSTFSKEIVVVDSASGLALSDYGLRIKSNSKSMTKAIRDKDLSKNNSYSLQALEPNLYQIIVFKDGYRTAEQTVYVNRNTAVIRVELTRLEQDEVIDYEDLEEEIVHEYEFEEDVEEEVEEITEEIVLEEVSDTTDNSVALVTDTAQFKKDGTLNDAVFNYNHIIFVIDVSTSMNKDEKLPLLKYSMAELIKVLRPEDKLTIISYSTEVNVLAQGISGSNKQDLLNIILSLEAKGQSYGSEALERAYEIAQTKFIEGGNNEIILASDGLFNSVNFKEKKVYKNARNKYKTDGVRLSTIAFGRSKPAIEFMSTAAYNGGGSFIRIPDEQTARTILVENILSHSKKSN